VAVSFAGIGIGPLLWAGRQGFADNRSREVHMWMSNILILVDRNNVDHNELRELADAVADTGATVDAINDERHLIEATAPSHLVPLISAMEGISYVRTVFNYHCPTPTADAAA
jgi:hypothetical protein